jgi:hypothetical protein
MHVFAATASTALTGVVAQTGTADDAVVMAGYVSDLRKPLTEASDAERIFCHICILAESSPSTAETFHAADGMHLLVKALTSHYGKPSVLAHVCRAMYHLCANVDNRYAFRDYAGIRPLARVLQQHMEKVTVLYMTTI